MVTTGFHKKKSKRVPARLRYKVEKKVRDHHRKQKREAKKNQTGILGKRKNKAVVIPGNVPFKDSIISEARMVKEREKERKKLLKGLMKGDLDVTKALKLAPKPVKRSKRTALKQKAAASAASAEQQMQCE